MLSYNREVVMNSRPISQNVRGVLKPTALAAGNAAVGVLVVFVIGSNVFDASMEVTMSGETSTIGAGLAVGFTIAVTFVAGAFAAALATVFDAPARAFTVVAGAVFALMAIGPITSAEDAATAVTLLAMHSVVLLAALAWVRPSLQNFAAASPTA